MTRDEILNMPAGREMRLAIAQNIFKWRWVDVPPDVNYENAGKVLVSPGLYSVIENGECQYQPAGKIDEAFYVRAWDTDIAAAWEINDQIPHIKLRNYGFWDCEFTPHANARGDTAPLAICRAALLAVMEEE